MRLVYYSLAGVDDLRERQIVESFRSLRRHSPEVKAFLVTYGGAADYLLGEAHRCGIEIRDAGAYDACLRKIHPQGDILAENPTYHKLLSLRHLPLHEASQILYLDCDTFVFRDIEYIFASCNSQHWYAREEPNSRSSHYGYDPRYLDESLLETIARNEGLRRVAPYNTGVCLMNHGVWWRLIELEATLLDYAWRFTLGLRLQAYHRAQGASREERHFLEGVEPRERVRALPFPSSNAWIVEQVALWLTLGQISGLMDGFFGRDLVMQGGEYQENKRMRPGCVVAHYFSNSTTRFLGALSDGGGF